MGLKKYSFKLCLIYAGIWGVAAIIGYFESALPDSIANIIMPLPFTCMIFFLPVAIGLFYNRLFEMGRWLIGSGLAVLSGIIFMIMFLMANPQGLEGLAYLLYGLITSTIISTTLIATASLMKQQKIYTRFLGGITLISVTLFLIGLSLYAMLGTVENLDYLFVALSIALVTAIASISCNMTLGFKFNDDPNRSMIAS